MRSASASLPARSYSRATLKSSASGTEIGDNAVTGADTWPVSKGRMFFFEKKNQKTFAFLRARCDWRGPQEIKVFCFFFSKKKSFLPSPYSTL
jgi:hypothetical protein